MSYRALPTKIFVNSILQMFEEFGIHISRHGLRGQSLGWDQPLVDLMSLDNLSTSLTTLARYGITCIGDITSDNNWSIPTDCEWVRLLIPSEPPTGHPSLRIGQFWQLPRSESLGSGDILQILHWTDEF